MLQVGVVDLVNSTATLTNEVPYVVQELDHVLRAKSFSMAPYARRLPPGHFKIQLDLGESGNWVLIPLHHHLALTLRDKRQRKRGNLRPMGTQLGGVEVSWGEETVEERHWGS